MKLKNKEAVIQLFVALRRFSKEKYKALVAELLKLPDATSGQKRFYNASRYSAGSLSSLEYDIKKICGITDKELSGAIKAERKVARLEVVADLPEALKERLKVIDMESANYNSELKPLAKEVAEALGLEPVSQKKADLIDFINANYAKGPTEEDIKNLFSEIFKEAPEAVKESIKLIDEFPFLDDEDCPDEFKILLSDKFKAYRKYLEGRQELKALIEIGATNEQIFEIAKKTVENYELNIDIYDELNHYKEHKQILGKHPIFADKMVKEKVSNMSTVELTTRQKNLRSYISRDQKTFDKMEDGKVKEVFGGKLQEWKDELSLVDARLDKIS